MKGGRGKRETFVSLLENGRTMKERRSFWDVPRVTRRCRGRPSRIYANRVGPLCPSSPSLPSSTTTKRSRSNFHPVRNFYFSSNETTKGGQSLASSARGGIGQEGDGGRGASGIHLFRDVQQRGTGDSVVSKTIDTITEEPPSTMGRRKAAGGSSPPLSFPPLSFSQLFHLLSWRSWIPFVSLPATRARNNERGRERGEEKKDGKKSKRKSKKSSRGGRIGKIDFRRLL